MAYNFERRPMLANTSKPRIRLPSIHELGLNLTRTDPPNRDRQVVDTSRQHKPDLTNFARRGCEPQRTSSPFHRTKRDCVVKPHRRQTNAAIPKDKIPHRTTKCMDEQKRRRNESHLQRRMQNFLLSRGHKLTEPLSEQNMKVSGLKFNKLEIMEEFIYEAEEMENPYAALARHIAWWRKLGVQIPRARELAAKAKAMPELSDECERDMGRARLLVEKMRRLLPSRHHNIVGIDVTTPEKEWKEQLQQLSAKILQPRLMDLAEMLEGEWKGWLAGRKRLTLRIWALKRKIAIIESRKLESAYSPSVLRSFHRNKRFPNLFSVRDLKSLTGKCRCRENSFIKSRL